MFNPDQWIYLLHIYSTKRIQEIYKKVNDTYQMIYNVENLIKEQNKIIEYNQINKDTHVENFIDIYLYKLYFKIRENQFNSWMFDKYYMDPNELERFKKEKKEYIESIHFLKERGTFLHYQSIFKEKESEEMEEFKGATKYQRKPKHTKIYKIDYQKAYQNQKEVGEEGEEIVLKKLEKRFENRKDLLEKIDHVSKKDDSKGYDISYIDELGIKNYIEVKTNASITSNKRMSFFISKNEDEFIKNHENTWIYYVRIYPKVRITKISREKYL